LLVLLHATNAPAPRELTQQDIDAAVMRTLENNTLPSRMAKAYDAIRPAVVRVRGMGIDENGEEVERSVGTGVVIVDTGVILTNVHVVANATKLQLVFFDGLESEGTVVGLHPEQDLAVLQAKTIPDDLTAATMRSTKDLALGDDVMAVGFPFGIGPSVSAGVVSGLRREYRSPEGKRVLTNLIQFDAAANPGNSGGTARHRRRRGGRHRHRASQPDRAARLHRHRVRRSHRVGRGRGRPVAVLRRGKA
jgi:S1-C subfamily serine protease